MLTFGLGWAFYWVRENHVGGAFAFFLLCLPIVFYLWRVIKKDFLSRNDPQQ
jgi:hypothetical protein